jgi:hypothetical protein
MEQILELEELREKWIEEERVDRENFNSIEDNIETAEDKMKQIIELSNLNLDYYSKLVVFLIYDGLIIYVGSSRQLKIRQIYIIDNIIRIIKSAAIKQEAVITIEMVRLIEFCLVKYDLSPGSWGRTHDKDHSIKNNKK